MIHGPQTRLLCSVSGCSAQKAALCRPPGAKDAASALHWPGAVFRHSSGSLPSGNRAERLAAEARPLREIQRSPVGLVSEHPAAPESHPGQRLRRPKASGWKDTTHVLRFVAPMSNCCYRLRTVFILNKYLALGSLDFAETRCTCSPPPPPAASRQSRAPPPAARRVTRRCTVSDGPPLQS